MCHVSSLIDISHFSSPSYSALYLDENYYECKSMNPIKFANIKYDGHFDYLTSFEGVSISDSRGVVIDGCTASEEMGVNDIVINDIDGSLNPAGASGVPSALVSNYPHMTGAFGDKCTGIGKCMAYCPGVCLSTFSLKVEQFGTENWKLRVTVGNDFFDIPGTIEDRNDYRFFSDAYRTRVFSVSLPAGAFTAEFIDEEGNQVWPTFVEEVWENPPDCSGYATVGDMTLLKPEVDAIQCEQLIRNGGQDATLSSTEPWLHTHPELLVGTGLGIDGSDAIITSDRRYHWTGPGQNIDTRWYVMFSVSCDLRCINLAHRLLSLAVFH